MQKGIKRITAVVIGFLLLSRGCSAQFQSEVWYGTSSNWVLLFFLNLAVAAAGLALIGYGFGVIKGRSHVPSPSSKDRILGALYEQVDVLMKSCFNEKTCEFDWQHFFNERDGLLYCGYPEIVNQMESDMMHFGYLQVLNILYSVLLPHGKDKFNPERLLTELRKKEPNIILNLGAMYGEWNKKPCPENVRAFRETLYDLIYGRKPCTESTVEEAIQQAEQVIRP